MYAIGQRLSAQLTPLSDATAHIQEPEMNREERLTYFVYVTMATLIAAFLAATLAIGLTA